VRRWRLEGARDRLLTSATTTGVKNVADPDIDVIDVGVGARALVARAKRLGAFGYGIFGLTFARPVLMWIGFRRFRFPFPEQSGQPIDEGNVIDDAAGRGAG
jgi:hypothetical protein